MKDRASGIFLPVFSLPSPYGIGDFGEYAYKLIDILSSNGVRFWQILPLNITSLENYNSPYMPLSAFAGNFIFISPSFLMKEKLIDEKDIGNLDFFLENEVDYEKVYEFKEKILKIAFENFEKHKEKEDFERFKEENSFWLEDFSLFIVLKKHFKKPWNRWPFKIKERDEKVLKELKEIFKREIEEQKFIQYIFYKEFFLLKNYANQKGVKIIGDIPIYLSYDSSEVWSNPYIFKLDENKEMLFVSGVPPDYFSEKGQLWGNPVYDWEKLKERNFDFWIKRIGHNLNIYDYLRIDHFRGFVAYWEIDAKKEDAREGKWVKVPSEEFFDLIFKNFPKERIIAEDLGFITPDVIQIMKKFDIPGMRVLIFGFDRKDPLNPHLPHNYIENCVAYTSTHDTNTLKGWMEKELKEKEFFFDYFNGNAEIEEIIRIIIISAAKLVIFPVCDLLEIGEKGRINTPGKKEGNWMWRLSFSLSNLLEEKIKTLKKFLDIYGRI